MVAMSEYFSINNSIGQILDSFFNSHESEFS